MSFLLRPSGIFIVIFFSLFLQESLANNNNNNNHSASAQQHLSVDLIKRVHLASQSDYIAFIRQSIPLLANRTLTVCVLVREPFVIYHEPEQQQQHQNGTNTTSSSSKPQGNFGQPQSPVSPGDSSAANQQDIDNYSGIAIEVLKRMRSIYGVRFVVTRPADNQFGSFTPGVGWSGVVGALVRREAHVAATALSITEKRAQVVDFTRAFYVETVGILLRIPDEVQNYLAVFDPLASSVWILLLITILTLIALTMIMTKVEGEQQDRSLVREAKRLLNLRSNLRANRRRSTIAKTAAKTAATANTAGETSTSVRGQRGDRSSALDVADLQLMRNVDRRLSKLLDEEKKLEWEFGATRTARFYYAVSCILNILLIRDVEHPPRQTPTRILVCVWWLATIVIVNVYLGILFGQLVLPHRRRSIETLEELAAQTQVGWSVTKGSAVFELFQLASGDSLYGQLGARMQPVANATEGIERVVRSGSAFIRERSLLDLRIPRVHERLGACKLQLAREQFFSVGFGLALTKQSPYLQPFDAALTLMVENGLIAHWQSSYRPPRGRFTDCHLAAPSEGEPLSTKHFISIYLVCSLLVVAALAILLYQRAHAGLSGVWSRRTADKVSPHLSIYRGCLSLCRVDNNNDDVDRQSERESPTRQTTTGEVQLAVAARV